MKFPYLPMALFAMLLQAASATVSVSSSAPATDVIASSPAGATDTALFDEAANGNHARGQLFSLPEGSGTGFQITAITIRKSTNQTFANDAFTLRIFEGTQSQWDSGSGHSTAMDGSDYFVDTTVTPLYTEAFTLNGEIVDNNYVTFELATPLVVANDSDFGFLMVYDQAGSADRFRHREAGAGGGRLSITTSNHGTSGSRRILHFIHGTSTGVSSNLDLAAPFQDGMVLQRDKPVAVWGTADPAATVTVNVAGQSAMTTAGGSGKWKAMLPALASGGPHQLVVSDGAGTKTLSDVLIGDVWLAFGQSNMVRPLNEMTGSAFYLDEIQNQNVPVRCLRVTQYGALTAQEDAQVPSGHYISGAMEWRAPSTAGSWTSVGTVFAYRMYEATGVPTAIVWAAWGSSSIEGWLPIEFTEQFPHFDALMEDHYSVGGLGQLDQHTTNNGFTSNTDALVDLLPTGWTGATSRPDIFVRTRPNVIYNQMIHPLLDFGLSGFVWYQGEANAGEIGRAVQYGYTFPAMVTEYRERFGQGDLPFLAVQLPSFNQAPWPWFRESQNSVTELPNAYTAVTIDTGLANNIHPFDKEPIGIRLSLLAREHLYGESIESSGPVFDSMSVAGNVARIQFTHSTGLTTDDGSAPDCFEIAGSNQAFHDATASIDGEDVLLSSPQVSAPVAVRYAWKPAPVNDVNLVNSAALPTAPFRTDDWPVPGLGAQAPQGGNDSYSTPNNVTLDVPVSGVLTNDFDLNGDALSAVLLNDVSEGQLTLNGDGSFNYIPSGSFVGTDSFTYQITDGSLSSAAVSVTIEVSGPLDLYAAWQSTIPWGAGDDQSRLGDPDGDGLVNLLEFAFDSDPLSGEPSALPVLRRVGAGFELEFDNVRDGVTYEVQLSTDLENWIEPPFAILSNASPMPIAIPADASGRLFVRIRVSD